MIRPGTPLVLLAGLVLMLSASPTAHAAPPSNDDFANAVAVTSLPFSNLVPVSEATTEAGEPLSGSAFRTIWYSITPSSDVVVRADLGASDYVTAFMAVYKQTSSGFAGLSQVAFGWYGPSFTFQLEGGATYYIQEGDAYPYGWVSTIGIDLQAVAPPPNDNFVNATPFTSVPFADSPDLTAATIEPGEPMACGTSFTQSVWYAFTPAVSGSYGGDPGVTGLDVYTGSSLGGLENVACSQWWGLAFHADAGKTYYLQYHGGGMRLDLLPPPYVAYIFNPADPSIFDTVSFFTPYYDPSVTTQTWDFGDGTTSSGGSASHKFSADGTYSVTFTETTIDGRVGSQTQSISVQTHDVSVLSLAAPDKAHVGKPSVITVGIGNTRYPESAQVDLYKTSPSGDVWLASATKDVPAMKPKKSVPFSFNYTFTNDDLAVGKVTFRAVATIQGPRDAYNADNTATSLPTIVAK